MNKQETINEILDHFDFTTVHKVMNYLKWTWFMVEGSGIPPECEIRKLAKDLLGRVYDEAATTPCCIATGGFSATSGLDTTSGKVYLELTFELAGWDNYD